MGKLPVIKKKIEKKKKEISKLKMQIIKSKKIKRLKRKEKLIKLGSLFFILDLLEEKQDLILGFLLEYKQLNNFEKEKLLLIGKEILLNKKNKKYSEDIREKKLTLHKMIKKSALLEKLKIHLEDPNIILGYLNTYKEKIKNNKEKYEKIGIELLKDNNEIISDEQKLKILKISLENKINITKILKEKYNKDIHNLKINEYLEIIELLKKGIL